MIKGIGINAPPLNLTCKVPKLVQWCTLRRNNNDDNELVYREEYHSTLAQSFEGPVNSCGMSTNETK